MGLHSTVTASWLGISRSRQLVLHVGRSRAGDRVADRRRRGLPVRDAPAARRRCGPRPLGWRRPARASDRSVAEWTRRLRAGRRRSAARRAPTPTFTGGEPLTAAGPDAAKRLLGLMIERAWRPFYAWIDPDRYLLAIWHGTLRRARAVGRASEWLERRAIVAVVAFAAVIGIVAATTSGVARTSAEAGRAQPRCGRSSARSPSRS